MTTRLFQQKKEKGIAILMSLGVLSLVLVLAMGYAYSSQGGLQLSNVNNDMSRANLLAEAAVQRCIGFLQHNFSDVAPHHRFVEEDDRFYLVSRQTDTSVDWDASEALTVNYPMGAWLDSSDLSAAAPGWIYVAPFIDTSKDGDVSVTEKTVTGRFAYAIINETGKLDPSYMVDVSGTVAADWDAEGHEAARSGDLLAELSLLGVLENETLAHQFHHRNNISGDAVTGGTMQNATRWLSQAHYFRSVSMATDEEDLVANYLFPWSLDRAADGLWNDYSGTTADDRIVDSSEIFDRIDITKVGTALAGADLYDHFMNATTDPTRNDPNKFSPWLRSQTGYTTSELRRIAAHTAVNIVDSADADATPSVVYLDSTSNYAMTSSKPTSYDFCLVGDDGQHHIGRVLLSLEMGRAMSSTDVVYRPKVQAGVYNPTSAAAFLGELSINYSMTIRHGAALGTAAGTFTISPASSPSWASVPVATTNWSYTATEMTGSGGTINVTTLPIPFVITTMSISSITATDGTNLLDVMPAKQSVSLWSASATVGQILEGETRYVYMDIGAKNPSFNGWHYDPSSPRDDLMMDFVKPTALVTSLPTFPATPLASWNTAAAKYGDVAAPRNAAFTRVSQLGAVARGFGYNSEDSVRVGGSLRFWSYTSADLDVLNHDGHLLDMFSEPDGVERGRININSPYSPILEELLSGAAASKSTAATNILEKKEQPDGSLKPFSSIGEFAGIVGVADNGVSSRSDDAIAEANVAKFYRFGTVRYNYFTILVVAQTLQDTGAVESTVEETAQLGPGKFANIRGEQKMLAVLARDNFTNDYKVLRLEHLPNE